ncbi:MAG TPA: TonB family protein [Thermoanaerobaculia bacterium]
MSESLPRHFGSYVLTARLGEDALGTVYRALREGPERGFVRLRILESPEIEEDAVLDAIQENGEIHAFLKNPAIARAVQMDSVEGVPFLAWAEESGRTLDRLVSRAPTLQGRIPIEHSLLIAEKIATGLDHAYNTTVEGERTLHGLVWPGFVSLSDDGETTLVGFGIAPGLLPSRGRPRFAKEISPYLAPEERSEGKIGKNSDVYSVGVILFELLTGRLPAPGGPVADLFAVARGPSPLPPEITAVLKMCLSEAGSRYQSSGELRRELGKLLFSGPYSPSTFNLAYFLNNVFGAEIEIETRAREKEAALEPGAIRTAPSPAPATAGAAAAPSKAAPKAAPPAASSGTKPGVKPPPPKTTTAPKFMAPPPGRKGLPVGAIVGGILLAAALAGTWLVISKNRTAPPVPTPVPTARPTATATPEPGPSTAAMTAAQFKEEVSRRVSEEVKKLEEDAQRQREAEASARQAALAATAAAIAAFTPTPAPTAVVVAQLPPTATVPPPPTATPLPAREIPPSILKIVKPIYPPVALQARIGGLVLLRVLVSETGQALKVEVLRGAQAGLTEAAVAAVKQWKFTPAKKGDTAVQAWTTVPIPFEP